MRDRIIFSTEDELYKAFPRNKRWFSIPDGRVATKSMGLWHYFRFGPFGSSGKWAWIKTGSTETATGRRDWTSYRLGRLPRGQQP